MMIFRSEGDVLAEVERRAKALPLIILDSETTGLDWKRDKTVGYVFTFGPKDEDSYYLPFDHASGPNYSRGKCSRLMNMIANLPNKRFVFHYADFDLGMLAVDGVTFPLSAVIEDTIVNEALCDEYARSYALNACCERRKLPLKDATIYQYIMDYFDLPDPSPKTTMPKFWQLPADDVHAHEYACADGTATWFLLHDQEKEIIQQELTKIHRIESDLILPLSRMKMQGVKVDVDRLQQSLDIVDDGYDRAIKALPSGLNVNSPKQIQKWMDSEGYTDYPHTPTFTNAKGVLSGGNASFPEEWLATNEAGRKVVAVRKLKHMKSTFLEPLRDEHMLHGRVHPNWNQTVRDDYGTVTYRLSCDHPNMQQAHKRNITYGVLYRTLFVPDDGMVWDSNDLVQCEPVLLAHFSGCKVLLDGFNKEPYIDAHQAVADAAGIARQAGKTLNQSLITGAGKNNLIGQLGADGARIYDEYFRAMPEIKHFLKDAATIQRSRGYVNTLLGHRCRLEDASKAYKAVNRVLQGSNADIIKESMVRIEREVGRGPDFAMLLNVHDALEFQHDESPVALEKLAHAKAILTDYGPGKRVHLDAPLRIDSDEGRNWSEATWGLDKVRAAYREWEVEYDG